MQQQQKAKMFSIKILTKLMQRLLEKEQIFPSGLEEYGSYSKETGTFQCLTVKFRSIPQAPKQKKEFTPSWTHRVSCGDCAGQCIVCSTSPTSLLRNEMQMVSNNQRLGFVLFQSTNAQDTLQKLYFGIQNEMP